MVNSDEAMRVFADIEEAAKNQPIGYALWARAHITERRRRNVQ